MAEYRITFSIERRGDNDDDFTEVGFGSSGGCGDVNAAAYEVESIIQNRQWETSGNMPEPEEVDA